MMRLPIAVAGAEHEMLISAGLLDDGTTIVKALRNALSGRGRSMPDRVFLVVDDAVALTHARRLHDALAAVGVESTAAPIAASETGKSVETLRTLAQRMVEARIDRHGLVIGVGGGIVGDLAGFAAATYLRGVPCALVPTTLLAMIDASIGGKTGANLELPDGTLGKNLLGTFSQPVLIVADPTTLSTLPPRVLRCGFAECVKHALVADAALLDDLDAHADALRCGDVDAIAPLIARSAAIKIAIVVGDERERGERAHLNLGHTFGHAIESERRLGLMHGEAVAIGLVAAMHLASALDRVRTDDVDRLRSVLVRLGLPTRLSADDAVRCDFRVESAMARMGFDKKSRAGRLHLVVPDGVGRVGLLADVPDDAVRAAWRSIGAIGGMMGGAPA